MEGFTPDQLLGLEMPPWNFFKRDLDSGEDKDPQRRAWAAQALSPELAEWNPDQLQGHHTPDQSSPPPPWATLLQRVPLGEGFTAKQGDSDTPPHPQLALKFYVS